MDDFKSSQKMPDPKQTSGERGHDTIRENKSSGSHSLKPVSQNVQGVWGTLGKLCSPFMSEPVSKQRPVSSEQPDSDPDNSDDRKNHTRVPQASEQRKSSRTEDKNHPRIQYSRKIQEQEAQILQLKANFNDLSQDSENRIRHLKTQLQQYRVYINQQASAANQHLRQLDEANQDLQGKLTMIEDRNRQLEGMIVAQQESALESMTRDKGYAPKEDQLVRDELSKLGEKLRNWARNHSAASLADLEGVTGKDKDLIVKELAGFTLQADWDTLIGKMTFSPSKIPALLVQSLLAKDMFERMFGNPFFAFTNLEGEPKIVPESEEMRRLYDIMAQIDEADAHIWRSQTMQNLSKSAGSESKSLVQQRIDSVCSQLVSDFVSGPASVLLRQVKNGGGAAPHAKELQALYKGMAQLASSLWTQRTFMVCESQEDLPVFNVANPALSAHRLHKLDEDDQRLDGKRVMLFVQPAIVAFGSENAEDYDQYKVWAPAIVVVDEM